MYAIYMLAGNNQKKKFASPCKNCYMLKCLSCTETLPIKSGI